MVDVALSGPPRWRVPGTPRTKITIGLVVLVAVGIGLVQGHPSGQAAKTPSASTGSVALPQSASAPAPQGTASEKSPAEGVSIDLGPSIVKTGTVALSVPVKKVSATLAAVTLVATQLSGQVSDSKTDESGAYPSGTITLRVPTAKTDDAIAALRKLGHVDAVSTSSQDVTGQVVDVGARLKALDGSRDRYLTLEGQAATIAETLQVQQRIDDVQIQIEQLVGLVLLVARRVLGRRPAH
jgi:hypothetical protein